MKGDRLSNLIRKDFGDLLSRLARVERADRQDLGGRNREGRKRREDGTSNFDGMLGSDTGHLEFLQLAFGNTHVLRQQTGRIVIAAGDAAVGVVQENLKKLF